MTVKLHIAQADLASLRLSVRAQAMMYFEFPIYITDKNTAWHIVSSDKQTDSAASLGLSPIRLSVSCERAQKMKLSSLHENKKV
jgi:hypothetical protein